MVAEGGPPELRPEAGYPKKIRSCRSWAGTRTPTTTSGSTSRTPAAGELLDEDADEVVDVVLLWWRDGDGDLVDRLMDAIAPLADDGIIWVVTPKTGKPGHVQPAEIAESAPTAGLMQTSSANLGGTGSPAGWCSRSRRRPGGTRDSWGGRIRCPLTSRSKTRTVSPSRSVTSAARRTCCWCSSRWRSPASAG